MRTNVEKGGFVQMMVVWPLKLVSENNCVACRVYYARAKVPLFAKYEPNKDRWLFLKVRLSGHSSCLLVLNSILFAPGSLVHDIGVFTEGDQVRSVTVSGRFGALELRG